MNLHILSGGAAAAIVEAVKSEFERGHRCTIEGTYSAVGMMRDAMVSGAACDLVILTRPMIEQLIASGHVYAGSAQSLGLVKTGIAVKAGARRPSVRNREELSAVLRAASGIYFPDPDKATAGIHFMNVLKALGVADSVRSALRPFPNGATAMREMADAPGENLIGCTQVTEINYTPGVGLVGLLPKEFELATDYTIGVAARGTYPQLAQQLAALLSGPGTADLRRAGGFEF